ncbi:MAG: nuclear transport factor 2 family protein [Myxococcota bacterium]
MAARKKARTTRRKATRKVGARRPARSKATRKKTARKKAARKKGGRKKAARKKTTQKKAARKRSPAKKAVKTVSEAEALARKIVQVTLDPSKFQIEDLYAQDCTSLESGGGPPAEGHEGLRQKMETWGQMQDGATWRARNVFVKGNTVSIEWDCDVKLKDGRSVSFREVAVHEIKGGKIVAERYYYDPGQLAPPAEEPAPPPPPPPPIRSDPSVPPVNPLDL